MRVGPCQERRHCEIPRLIRGTSANIAARFIADLDLRTRYGCSGRIDSRPAYASRELLAITQTCEEHQNRERE
jgi:hypothetical protein